MPGAWQIFVRASDFSLLGEVTDYGAFRSSVKFNAPGSWELEVEALGVTAGMMDWGRGLVVTLNGTTMVSGPLTARRREWDAESGVDKVTFTGATDEVWLARRIAYPEPPNFVEETEEYDERAGRASTIMCDYVDVNLGPNAVSQRQPPRPLEIVDPVVGDDVAGAARFEPLDELLRGLALRSSPELGFRLFQYEDHLRFLPYVPVDRSAPVVFNSEFGSVASFEYEEGPPEANFFVVGGIWTDEFFNVHKTFREGDDTASVAKYGRIEKFDNRGDMNRNDLPQALREDLARQANPTAFGLTPVDTGAIEFGRDYSLGDKVTAIVDGDPIVQIVREVSISLDDAGARTIPTVGTPETVNPRVPRLFRRLSSIAELERRVLDLERRVNP